MGLLAFILSFSILIYELYTLIFGSYNADY